MPSVAVQTQSRPPRSVMPAHAPRIGTHSPRRNSLLNAFPDDVLERIYVHLEPIDLHLGSWLIDQYGNAAKYASQYVYFPIDAIVSLVCVTANGAATQTAMVGHEGMVGIASCVGGGGAPICAVVQSAGYAFKLPVRVFAEAFEGSPAVTQILLRYSQSLMTQIGQTAVCNRHHLLEQQLCRWLLSSLDRVTGTELYVTQELISNMLGVRREGVTEAAGRLQRLGMINLSRGCITVIDRDALAHHACECYEVIRRDTDRFQSLVKEPENQGYRRGQGPVRAVANGRNPLAGRSLVSIKSR